MPNYNGLALQVLQNARIRTLADSLLSRSPSRWGAIYIFAHANVYHTGEIETRLLQAHEALDSYETYREMRELRMA